MKIVKCIFCIVVAILGVFIAEFLLSMGASLQFEKYNLFIIILQSLVFIGTVCAAILIYKQWGD